MYNEHKVCVVLPAYNEEPSIGAVLDRMPGFVDQVVVVDDGSTDETAKIARGKDAMVVGHSRNRGVGTAFQTGVKKALELNADVMVNMDADGQFDPGDIEKLIEPIIRGEADFVTASRFVDRCMTPRMPKIRHWGNIAMSGLVSFLVDQKFYDVSCGFRAYSREALLRLNLLGKFTYTQETFLDLAFKGLALKEVPVVVRGVRQHGQSKLVKSLPRYIYRTLKIILRAFRDYKPWKFFSFLAAVLFGTGLVLELFMLVYYIWKGRFSPYKFVGVTGGFFLGMGVILFITGLLADMLNRIRVNQEEILYHERKEMITRKSEP